jgi:NAD+ synthase (glutamine-hydrolysing)
MPLEIDPPLPLSAGHRLRLALHQLNSTIGDFDGNLAKMLGAVEQARAQEADIIAFPELAVCGYPPEDLLLKPGFLRANLQALERLAAAARDIVIVTGFVDVQEDLYNAAAILCGGTLAGVHRKFFLPNYGVFDENRYFQSGSDTCVFTLRGVTFGVTVCEDIWYSGGPARLQALNGDAQLVININASPFHAEKWRFREKMLATRASDDVCFLAYVNQVGGQDELVFDGHSMVFDPEGVMIARGPAMAEALVLVDLDPARAFAARLADPRRRQEKQRARGDTPPRVWLEGPALDRPRAQPGVPFACPLDRLAEVWDALVIGTRDYVNKNGFGDVVIGISGGIDSALVAAVAADALGRERVHLVSMPSVYNSAETQSDAEQVAHSLGVDFRVIPIQEAQVAYGAMLADSFRGLQPNIAEENLQARTRGNLLMALSNKLGWLVLTTGNKSEMATGYATLYGDMAGGFAVIKDVPKTLVFQLAAWRNGREGREVIPESIITRPPSAELRPDQKDTDSLPPYDVLDPILQAYVEDDRGLEEIVAMGFDRPLVERVIMLVDRSEYKRRQAPPGVKITPKAFGKDRRLPLTNRFHDVG